MISETVFDVRFKMSDPLKSETPANDSPLTADNMISRRNDGAENAERISHPIAEFQINSLRIAPFHPKNLDRLTTRVPLAPKIPVSQ